MPKENVMSAIKVKKREIIEKEIISR